MRPDRWDDGSSRYLKSRECAVRYRTCQVGLSAFRWDKEAAAYEAATFNASVWPQGQRFTVDAGAMEFLVEHGFDWQALVTRGLTYCTQREEAKKRNKLKQELEGGRERVVVRQPEGISFLEKTVEAVRAWLDGTTESRFLVDPAPGRDRFLKRAVYEALEHDFDKGLFTVERADSVMPGALRLIRGSDPEAAEAKARAAAERAAAVDAQCQFNALWRVLVESGVPLVVHNGMADLTYMLHHFHQPLPDTLAEFKVLVAETFKGGVFDTKHLARLRDVSSYGFTNAMPLGDAYATAAPSGHTDTNRLITRYVSDAADGTRSTAAEGGQQSEQRAGAEAGLRRQVNCPLPVARHAALSPRYGEAGNGGGSCHEAGFDAWQTAYLFSAYARLLHAGSLGEGEAPSSLFTVEPSLELPWFAENKGRIAMPFPRHCSFPSINLDGEEDQEDLSHAFVVVGLVPQSEYEDGDDDEDKDKGEDENEGKGGDKDAAGASEGGQADAAVLGEESKSRLADREANEDEDEEDEEGWEPTMPTDARAAAQEAEKYLGLGRWEYAWLRPGGEILLALRDRRQKDEARELFKHELGWDAVPLPEYRGRANATGGGAEERPAKRQRGE